MATIGIVDWENAERCRERRWASSGCRLIGGFVIASSADARTTLNDTGHPARPITAARYGIRIEVDTRFGEDRLRSPPKNLGRPEG